VTGLIVIKPSFYPKIPYDLMRDIVSQLNAAVVNAVASPDLQERLQMLGSEPVSTSPEQMLQRLRNDAATLTQIVKTAGIKGE
jgi:tripartite-type tricarboxylate transporter receptor subunit TctC